MLLSAPWLAAQAGTDQLSEDDNYKAACNAALAQPLPPEAAELEAQAKSGASPAKPVCDEQQFYYGFGRPPAYHDTLLCAYLHRAGPGHQFLTGSGTLAMLYANGDGVPRDYGLAIRFACEADTEGGQNTEQRIGRLEALRDDKLPTGTRFDVCDEQMSEAMGGYCAYIQDKAEDANRSRRLAHLSAHLPKAAQAIFPQLQAAETAFEKARGLGEYTEDGGSGSAGFEALDQGQLPEQFFVNLRRFASGDLPTAGAADRRRARQRLQSSFDNVESKAPVPGGPNLNLGARDPDRASFAVTQRAWQALFDQWMRFIPVAYPMLPPDQAATELLRLRIHQLRKAAPAE